MKKLWAVVLVGALLLTGCSGNKQQQASSKSSESVRSAKKVTKSTSVKKLTKAAVATKSANAVESSRQVDSVTSQSKAVSQVPASSQASSQAATQASQSTTRARQATTTLWNATKTQQLSAFMKQWQTAMGQTYQGTYDGANPNHLGFVFPYAITSGEMAGRVSLGNQPVNLTWSTNGENGQAYQVVAVATGNKTKLGFPTTYLFCLHNQQPVVYMSQTTNGNIFYIQSTQNAELQAGFANIVNGQN